MIACGMDDPEDDRPILDVTIPGPDGRMGRVRARAIDGPKPCPFCDQTYTVFETLAGEGLVAHPHPICPTFDALKAEVYLGRVREAIAGVNGRGRGSA